MASKALPIVSLDENSLRRLHQKLLKMKENETQETYKTPENQSRQRKAVRSPKFEVYRPGVTRLSNRTDNLNRETKKNSTPTKLEENSKEHKIGKSRKPLQKDKEKRYTREKQKEVKRSTTQTRSTKSPRQDSDESSDMEEGYLTRQNKRLGKARKNSTTSSTDGTSEKPDELERDNYNHSRLFDTWGDQHQQENKEHEYTNADEYSEEEEKSPIISRKKERRAKSRKPSETSKAVVPKRKERMCYMDEHGSTNTDGYSDHNETSSSPVKEKQRENVKKKLYDPSNPDTPIMVKSNRRAMVKPDNNATNETQPVYNQEYFLSSRFPSPNLRNLPHDGSRQRTLYNAETNSNQIYVPRTHSPRSYPPPQPQGAWGNRENYLYMMEQQKMQQKKEQEEALIADHMTSIRRQSCVTMFSEAERHETAISSLLSSCEKFTMKNFTEKLLRSRNKLKKIYESLILTDVEVAAKHNVEQLLWKNVFHQVIEKLREQIASCTEDEKTELRDLLILILDQAAAFYENLLSGLQQTYRFSVKEMLCSPSAAKSVHKQAGKRTKFAIMSCQRSLLCLGDITRYREIANESNNFGRARNYYMQARSLEPRNGRPYNQLAILALRTRRKLDAVYYYARSLAITGNPILTARESLIALFDDARRKLEYTRRKETESKPKSTTTDGNKQSANTNGPSQIWCLPGSSHPKDPPTSTEEQSDPVPKMRALSLSSILPSEALKQFNLMFVNLHGKLFTRVGFESFYELQKKVLQLFEKVLQIRPFTISSQTLLHVFTINYFSVFDQYQKSHNENSSSSMCAVQLTLDMIAILTKEVTVALLTVTFDPMLGFVPSSCKELDIILPSFKLACDWLFSNRDIWYPHPPMHGNRSLDLWTNLAGLCDWLCSDDKQFSVRTFTQSHHDLVEVNLAEDFEMSGFYPLAEAESEPRFVMKKDVDGADVDNCVRLNLIRDFLEYLCGMEQPLLAFKQGRYVALVRQEDQIESSPQITSYNQDLIDPDLPDIDTSFEEQVDSEDEFSELKAYRDSLQKTRDVHEKRRNQIQASLDAAGSGSKTMYITPKSVIPDTNCFIDHLDMISDLLENGQFTVCVCLVVLSELEGLAQESKGNTEHNRRVHASAVSSMQFIKQKFTSRHSALCALTNQGSALDTISFRSQNSYSDKGSNDDLILQCCEKYEERTKNSSFPNTSSTVLLTDDRNLRVKALTRNMPTKSLPEFWKWISVAK